MIRNISLGGAFVESVAQLKFGDSIRVQFVVPQLHESIDVAAEVRWTDATEGALSGVGIQFQGLRARHVWALQACFAGLQAASA
jgi:Tfp pilus assembly protein PilZ